MNDIRTQLLAPENAKATMEQLANATDSELTLISASMAQAPDQHPEFKKTIEQWDSLRQAPGLATRYNSYQRFLSNIINNKDADNTQFATIIYVQDKPVTVLRGNFSSKSQWRGMGALNKLLPTLQVLTLPETSIVADDSDQAKQLVCDYLSKLIESKLISLLNLDNLKTESKLTNAIVNHPVLAKALVKTQHIRWIRQLLDPETKEPINQNSAKTRSSWRRKHRNLEKEFDGDLVMAQIDDPSQVNDFVVKASSIVDQTYQSALGIGVRDNHGTRAFISEMAAEGLFRGYLVSGQGKAISYVAGDVDGGRFNLWATSFLPEYMRLSPGLVLLNHVVSELTNEGVEILDFGHGEAAYKERFGNTKFDEVDLHIYSAGLINAVAYKAEVISIWLKTNIKKLSKKLNLTDIGRRWWRKLLQNRGASTS